MNSLPSPPAIKLPIVGLFGAEDLSASSVSPPTTTTATAAAATSMVNTLANLTMKLDLEHHKSIRMQQMEAYKLIQVSLDKLNTTAVLSQVPSAANNISSNSSSSSHQHTNNANNQRHSRANGSDSPPSHTSNNNNNNKILVYKEVNLHKNLLVSKILNKAKYFFYQSIVQSMRFSSLISSLNYYSTLIQQLNASKMRNNANQQQQLPTATTEAPPMQGVSVHDEAILVDEMRFLMQQLLNEASQSQFHNNNNNNNNNIPFNFNLNLLTNVDYVNNTERSTTPTALASNGNEAIGNANPHHESSQQIKRIKQLNEVKLSLYSLMHSSSPPSSSSSSELSSKRLLVDAESSSSPNNNSNSNKRQCNKRHKPTSASGNHITDASSTSHVILGDDTNVINKNALGSSTAGGKMMHHHNSLQAKCMFSKARKEKRVSKSQASAAVSTLPSCQSKASSSSPSSPMMRKRAGAPVVSNSHHAASSVTNSNSSIANVVTNLVVI